jgi:Tannase and feruloyl esterase
VTSAAGRPCAGGRPPRRRWRALTVLCALTAVLAVASPAGATGSGNGTSGQSGGLATLPPVAPLMDCSAIAQLHLDGVTDGTVTITSATALAKGAAATASHAALAGPACDVTGSVGPGDNRFEVLLPTTGWTQRYLQVGCGGLCGNIGLSPAASAGCQPVTDGSFVMAATDMGHQAPPNLQSTWTAQAILDFAYRGQHVTAQVAKSLIGHYYGQAPAYSYFDGCSDGGREALMEAQRYPQDFDGIVAGAPANDLSVQNTYHHTWNVVANQDANGTFILLAGKLPLIHAAVLARCDALDGVRDGVLDDPRRCDFDPGTLQCKAGQDPSTCLSAAEVSVVRKLHEGPVDAQGRHLEQPIAHEWGSELQWSLFVPATAGGPSASQMFAQPYLQFLAFQNQQDPTYQLSDLQFTVPYFWKTVQSSAYLSATDPDLSAFQRGGGKLVLWHGWEDQHITPQSTLDYYASMKQEMGAKTVDRFARLYMLPGVAHCGGGDGPDAVDLLTPLMAWTETHSAPGKVIASQVVDGAVVKTRPVFPYPQVARYDGSGSTDDAANFVPYTPPTEPAVGYDWVGQPLYSHGYQTTVSVVGNTLVSAPARRSLPPGGAR